MSRFAVAVIVLVAIVTPVRADDWPQWLGPKRDGVWTMRRYRARPVRVPSDRFNFHV